MKNASKETAFSSIVDRFGYSPIGPAIWRKDTASQLQMRSLSLDQASQYKLVSRHLKAAGVSTQTQALGDAKSTFAFLFVLSGQVVMHETGKQARTFNGYGSACRFGQGQTVNWSLSHDAEVIEIVATSAGSADLGMSQPAQGAWHVCDDHESDYVMGEGPRKFFKYRDLGVAAATNRRIHIHVVRATQAVNGGTGWHSHSMGQLFYVLRGWADLAVQNQPWVRMHSGDAMCISPRMSHNVPGFTDDYLVLEMCIPADYDTVDAPAED